MAPAFPSLPKELHGSDSSKVSHPFFPKAYWATGGTACNCTPVFLQLVPIPVLWAGVLRGTGEMQ